MRALASPASCKGVLSAVEGAMALAAGMQAAGLEADELPVADGGEGTAEVFAAALGGEWREAAATDPIGRAVRARFLVLADGSGVVEAAEAIGLRLLSENELDPMSASSRGLGELLLSVADETSGSILVGLGDTATVDGGAGLLEVVRRVADAARPLRPVRREEPAARGAGRCAGVRPAEGRLAGTGRGARGAAGLRSARFGPTRSFLERAPPAGSARRSPRSAGSSSRGRASSSSASTSVRRRPGRTSWSRARGRSTARASRARQSEKCCAPAVSWTFAASSSAGWSRSRRRARARTR